MNEETAAEKAQKTTMQNVVQEMLPDNLKNKFVLQKNAQNGTGDTAAKPLVMDPLGNTPAPTAPPLDPNLVQKPMRTFESDLAQALAQKQGSTASISIAEKKRKEEESRKNEALQQVAASPSVAPQQPPPPPRPIVHAVAPTSATAIPGATISIPPLLEKEMGNEINAEIEEALRAAKPQPVSQSVSQPIPQQVSQPLPQPAPVPPSVAPIPKPVPPPVVKPISIPVPPPPPQPAKPSRVKPLLLILFSLIFIIGGAFEGYVLYKKSVASRPPPVPEVIIIPSIIPHDEQVTVAAEGEGNQFISKLYAEINKRTVQAGKNLELVVPVTASNFILKLNTRMPSVIERSLTDRWMFGVYGEETGQKTTFLALTTDFFQNAFAGMLQWEDNMPDDLALILNFKDRARKDELNSTSTISSYFSIKGDFIDRVIRNRDVREFRSQQDELLFLYSFINKETLLLTTTESAFIALIDRIEKDAYVR